MTRPTEEQIRALKKGDTVLIRATVKRADGGLFPFLNVHDKALYVAADTIVSIEARPLEVGDRVKRVDCPHAEWEVAAPTRIRGSDGVTEVALWNAASGYAFAHASAVERIA